MRHGVEKTTNVLYMHMHLLIYVYTRGIRMAPWLSIRIVAFFFFLCVLGKGHRREN